MMIFTTCAIFSIANASSEVSTVKTANQRNVAVESDAALKMKNLMIKDDLYKMIAMLNATAPNLSAAANQATTIKFQSESLAEMKKINSQIQVSNIIILKTLQEIQEIKKGN